MAHTTTTKNPAWYLEAWRKQARREWQLEQLSAPHQEGNMRTQLERVCAQRDGRGARLP